MIADSAPLLRIYKISLTQCVAVYASCDRRVQAAQAVEEVCPNDSITLITQN